MRCNGSFWQHGPEVQNDLRVGKSRCVIRLLFVSFVFPPSHSGRTYVGSFVLAAAFLVVLAARSPLVTLAPLLAALVSAPFGRAGSFFPPVAVLGPVATAAAFAALMLELAISEATLPLLVGIAQPVSRAHPGPVSGSSLLVVSVFLHCLAPRLSFPRGDVGREDVVHAGMVKGFPHCARQRAALPRVAAQALHHRLV